MSWLGGSLSSLTGQLSNLTKDILTEGTEEISDPATELRLAKEKIDELNSLLTAQKSETERLKRINKDVEEKAESSELQINAISREYRGVLETKEKEVNNLKRQHTELLEQQARSAVRASSQDDEKSLSSHKAPKAAPSGFGDDTDSFSSFNYDGDTSDWDFDDSIRLQRENNRLRSDLQNATAEAKHWRNVAGQLGQKSESHDAIGSNSAEILELQSKIKELESSLSKKGEQLQQQATSLHEHHRQKVATLKERHSKEVKTLQEKVNVLEQQLSDGSSGSHHSGTLPESERPNASREGELERKLANALSEKEKALNARVHLEGILEELQQEVERLQDLNERQGDAGQGSDMLQAQLSDLSQRLEKSEEENKELKSKLKSSQHDAVRSKLSLLERLNANHADVQEALGDLQEMRESWDMEAYHRHDNLRADRRHLVNQMFHVGHKKNETSVSLLATKDERDDVMARLEEIISTIGDVDCQKKTAELLNTIEKENMLLKEQNTKLEEQVILLEKTTSNFMTEKQSMLETMAIIKSRIPVNPDEMVSDDDTMDTRFSSSTSALQVKEEEVDAEVMRLRSQLGKMKEENSNFEMERSDWLMEKETLEEVVTDLQKKSQEQEDEIQSLKSSETKGSTRDESQQGDSEGKIEELETEAASLREENKELEKALEELDSQHSEALAQLIGQRDNLAAQISTQTAELDKYRHEIESLNATIEQTKVSGDKEKRDLQEKCEKYEQELSEWKEKSKGADVMENKMKELKEKIEKGGLVINDLHMDKQDLEQQLQKAREDAELKVVKLKESRCEKAQMEKEKRELEERLGETEDRLMEAEVEVEKWQQLNEVKQTEAMEKRDKKEAENECSRLRSKIEFMEQEKETIKEEFQFLIDGNKDHVEQMTGVEDSAFQHIFEEELKVRQKLEEEENSVQEMKEYVDKLRNERQELKQTIVTLKCDQNESKSILESIQTEKAEFMEQLASKASDLDCKESELVGVKAELENVKRDKFDLQNSLTNVHKEKEDLMASLESQEKYYEACILELKAGQDAGDERLEALRELNEEMERLREEVKDMGGLRNSLREKSLEFDNLTKEVESYQNEIQSDKLEISRLLGLCQEKDKKLNSMNEKTAGYEQNLNEMEESLRVTNEQHQAEMKKNEEEVDDLKSTKKEQEVRLNEMQDQLKMIRSNQQHHEGEELTRLRCEIEELKNECVANARNLSIISQLESELSSSTDKIASLKEELFQAKEVKFSSSHVNELNSEYGNTASSLTSAPENNRNEAIEVMEKEVSNPLLASHSPSYSQDQDIEDIDNDYDRFVTLEKDMEELRGKLSEKDTIVFELQRSNASLLELLEKKADGDSNLGNRVAYHKLEAELKTLRAEREHMVAVVSEKSRESSSLKSEIHRLMDLVSAGQTALNKAQQDNLNLEQQQRQSSPPRDDEDEMKREALNNMARLVRDKDTEVEALTQKNNTLLAVLQESSESQAAAHLGPLLKEKETLSQQVAVMMSEREQLITCVTQKHNESLAFHAEVKRLTGLLVETQEAMDKAKAEYATLIPAFEGKTQALINTQQELVECKQKLTELEIRHGELIQRSNSQQNVPDSPTVISDLEAELEKYKRLECDYKAMVVERDSRIQSLSQKVKTSEEVATSKEAECLHLKKQLDNSKFQLTGLMAEIADAKSERELVQQKSETQNEESTSLRNGLNQMTLAVKDKDVEILSLKDKISTLNSVMQNQKGEQDQVAVLIRDHESTVAANRQLQQERDYNAMVAEQRLQECDALKAELSIQKDKVFKLGRELERLRSHLLEIEEGYTKEALDAEEREKDLRNKLAVAEEQLLTSSSHVQLASQESHRQIESLQEQLHHLASQRDSAYMQVAITQDQCEQYAASLSNLQLVLEHFQKEKDSAVALETEKYQEEAKSLSSRVKELERELEATRGDLTEALDGLDAASRISEQLDRKEDALLALKEEVQLREKALKEAEEEIIKLNSSTEAKVDKMLMHNMVLTWLTSPEKKRHEIVQLIGHVLDFSSDDFSKIESAHNQDSLWIGFFKRSKTEAASIPKADQSFSQLFVKFLEKESSPPPTPVKLPVEAMAAEAQLRHKTTFNPFMAPRHVTHGNDTFGASSSSSSSHLLIPQDTPHPSPLFAPVTSVSSTGESAILKDVLSLKR